jgi:hypothetical protein
LPQDPPAPKDDPARAAAIEQTLASGKVAEKLALLRAQKDSESAEIVKAVGKALADADVGVRVEAIEALARAKHGSALELLLAYHKEHRKALRADEVVLPKLLRAIARSGDERAVDVLADDVQGQLKPATLSARILGLGRVRSKRAADALVRVMGTIGFAEQQRHLEDFRLTFVVLTGSDQGRTFEAWSSWWSKNRESFALPRETPKLSAADQERWNAYWAGAPSKSAK